MGTRSKNSGDQSPEHLKTLIVEALDANKAEEIEVIDLMGQTSLADYMVIASGSSSRLVASLADKIDEKLRDTSFSVLRTEGLPAADWVVVDCGDVIVHLFRPEVRSFYAIEKMWQMDLPPLSGKTSPRTANS